MSAPKLIAALAITVTPGTGSASSFTTREHVARLGANTLFNPPVIAKS